MSTREQSYHATEPLLHGDEACAASSVSECDPDSFVERGGDEEACSSRPGKASEDTGRVSWPLMTLVLLGDMFGLGTLTLPADFARLGWLPALLIMAVCLCGTLYSGRLFTLLARQVPKARVFDDFGKAALGRNGQRLVYLTVYGTILLNPIIFQLTSVESLDQIFYQHQLPTWALGLIVAGIMLPLAQVQGLEDVAALSVIGTVGMLTAVGVAVAKFCIMDPPSEHTQLVHKPRKFNTPIVALLDIVFTYGGQVNWVRYITQMRVRKHFPRSVTVTALVMTAAYVVMGSVGYARLGPNFDHERPITSVIPQDAIGTPLMNAGLFAHCILAYQINMNVWTDLVLHLLHPFLHWPEERLQNPGWLSWCIVSTTGVALSFAIAATFPYFSTVAAIIASLGDLAGAYALPAIFLLTLAGSSLAAWEKGLLKLVVPLTVVLSLIGLVSSIYALVLNFVTR